MLIMSVEFHLGNYIGIGLEKEVAEASVFSWGAWSYQFNGIQLLGLLRTENTILVVLLSFLIRALMQRFAEEPLLMGGFLDYALFYGLIAYCDRPWVLFGAMVIATFGELLYVPIKHAYLGCIVPEHARGSYMALDDGIHRSCIRLENSMRPIRAYGSVSMHELRLCIFGRGDAGCFRKRLIEVGVVFKSR
ncbi:hypothetical protein [Paenibacillus silviterrae]|uniref:hypothetical protein n=1 Tax=Paenibacillus silviterrae TaxID=3242194 RepID=UPI0025431D2E|nr:hypothetical protein [Paenibacillus chinjuensis]